jgi:hypothetical protein
MLQLIRNWILPGPPPQAKLSIARPLDKNLARRRTAKYKRKQSLVKSIWITSGLIMLTNPVLPFIAALSLLTTFLSFVILDETP